jgi:hypothetical protein
MAAGWQCDVIGQIPEIGLDDSRLTAIAALVRA